MDATHGQPPLSTRRRFTAQVKGGTFLDPELARNPRSADFAAEQ